MMNVYCAMVLGAEMVMKYINKHNKIKAKEEDIKIIYSYKDEEKITVICISTKHNNFFKIDFHEDGKTELEAYVPYHKEERK